MLRFSTSTVCTKAARFSFRKIPSSNHRIQIRNMASIVKNVQETFSQNLGGAAHANAPADAQFSLDEVPDQSGKVAVVTGGSEGIASRSMCVGSFVLTEP